MRVAVANFMLTDTAARLLSLHANVRLARKTVLGTNALAYFALTVIDDEKSFSNIGLCLENFNKTFFPTQVTL
jgi:hypothetical protein